MTDDDRGRQQPPDDEGEVDEGLVQDPHKQSNVGGIVRDEIQRRAASRKAQIDTEAIAVVLSAGLDDSFEMIEFARRNAGSDPVKHRAAAEMIAHHERLMMKLIDRFFQ